MQIKTVIQQLLDGQHLAPDGMRATMRHIMQGEATPSQIAAFLVALRAKGETVEEITAAVQILRELATVVDISAEHLIDTCGTGGDGAQTFNISTTAAFVVAAAGGRVAKHGGRSVSSTTGSADVLEAAGVNINLTPAQVKLCIEQVGIGFLFAPHHNAAMRHVAVVRREISVRTLFNLLGPLNNPARAPYQLIGVFAREWLEPMAQVLKQLGSRHVLLVNAEDGLDEISIASPTHVAELKAGVISSYTLVPEQFGMQRETLEALSVSSAEQSLKIMRDVLANQAGPARDIVALNAGAAIYVADLISDLAGGIQRAYQVLADGSALRKLDELITFTHTFH